MDETIPGKVSGEGTFEQTTVMPCKIQSFSSNAIYAEKRLFHFSSFFFCPLFSLELHLKAVKNFCDFLLGSFPTPIPFSPSVSTEALCKENSPCQQNQSFHKWLMEWSSLLILQQTDSA